MNYMKHQLDLEQPPANIMEALRRGEVPGVGK